MADPVVQKKRDKDMDTPVGNSAKNKVLAAILFVGSLVLFLGVTEIVVGHYEKQNMKVPRLVYYLTYTPCLFVSGLAFANFSKVFSTGNDKREKKHLKR